MSDEELLKKIKELEKRVEKIENFLRSLPTFDETIEVEKERVDEVDELYDQALMIVLGSEKVSASFLQRRLQIGFARACRLLEQLEENGIIGTADGSKPRDVLIKQEDIELLRQKLEDKKELKERKKKHN